MTILYLHGIDLLTCFELKMLVPTNLLADFIPAVQVPTLSTPVIIRHRTGTIRHELAKS